MDWKSVFATGLKYGPFLDAHGTPAHRERWAAMYERVSLSSEQLSRLDSFGRQMNVLCLAGAWCGDCVNQCPIFQRFSEACGHIDLRFIDRDANPQLSAELSINGGRRVPVLVFLSEDFQECGRYGDRTLSKYREMASTLGGAACPVGLGDPLALTAAVIGEWLAEFERVQWMLRLSSRLRAAHGD